MKKFTLALTTLLGFATAVIPATSNAATGSNGGNMFMLGFSAIRLDTQYSGTSLTDQGLTNTIFTGKIGYVLSNGLYLGGVYDSRTDESTVNQTSTKNERTGYGGSVGYHNSGWFIEGAYYLSSTYKTPGNEYKSGSGFGVDLGHNWDLAANVYLGLQLSYKSFTYTKKNSIDETNKFKSELTPMLNLGVQF